MIISVNGESKTIARERLAVAELLSLCRVESPDLVSVQLNGKFLGRDHYATTQLNESDEVDFLYFLGGGR
jgi:sulfur carrier protein